MDAVTAELLLKWMPAIVAWIGLLGVVIQKLMERGKIKADAASALTDAAADNVKTAMELMEKLQNKVTALECEVRDLKLENKKLIKYLKILIGQVEELGCVPKVSMSEAIDNNGSQ